MFGLKIIKKQEYVDLKWRLDNVISISDAKETTIEEQAAIIKKLSGEIENLKKRISELETPSKPLNEPVLLTDVAEVPLKEEKPAKKTRKPVQKKEGTTARKRVVRKTEE